MVDSDTNFIEADKLLSLSDGFWPDDFAIVSAMAMLAFAKSLEKSGLAATWDEVTLGGVKVILKV
jgi:hypothetical protein